MTTCEYCGKPNDPSLELCEQCGTNLPLPLPPVLSPIPALPSEPNDSFEPPILGPPIQPVLNAGRAAKIFAGYFLAQIIAGVIGGAVISATTHPESDSWLPAFGLVLIFTLLAAGLVLWQMSRELGRSILLDPTLNGACWLPGSFRQIIQGLVLGAALATIYLAVVLTLSSPEAEEALGPLSQMAATPGLPQIEWLFLALILAPPIEELLFRGIMFGGFTRSYGPVPATLLTTTIFVALHFAEAIHFLPSFLFLAGLGLGAIWLRVRFAAIGPSIAFHFGYNATLGLAIFATT